VTTTSSTPPTNNINLAVFPFFPHLQLRYLINSDNTILAAGRLCILTVCTWLTYLSLDAMDDLISLADSAEGCPNPTSPTSFGSFGRKMPVNRRTVERDSFSDLAVMMKAKKPYAPIPPPTPRPSLSLATNGECCGQTAV
jgi:hypothetical protein